MNSVKIPVDPATRQADALMFSLLEAAHALEARLENELALVGLSMSKLGVLTQLVEAEAPIALSALAARLSCVRSNMTQLVDRLEADGLVRRIDDPDDRRSVLAMVTPEGERRQAEGARQVEKVREGFVESVPAADRAVLARALAGITE
jgi:DNA-binding MarR family transcriptional regulator